VGVENLFLGKQNGDDGGRVPQNPQAAQFPDARKMRSNPRRTGGNVFVAGQRRKVLAANRIQMYTSP
jgi:hypothetical protein